MLQDKNMMLYRLIVAVMSAFQDLMSSCVQHNNQCFFQGLGGNFPPKFTFPHPPPPQTIAKFVCFFTFSFPTKAIPPPNYISRKNPDNNELQVKGPNASN